MDTTEIIQGNRLIAEFMSTVITSCSDAGGCYDLYQMEFDSEPYSLKEMEFHESFDWLMPVVEKIVRADSSFHLLIGNVASICRFESQWDAKPKGEGRKYSSTKTIEAVWLAVIEFIKWHNQSK